MILAHKIELIPNNRQKGFFIECAGAARGAYNWALENWKKQYSEGNKPNEAALRKELNSIKKIRFPWMLRLPKSVVQESIKNLGLAYKNFFLRIKKGAKGRKAGYPQWKSKHKHKMSFRIDDGSVKIDYPNCKLWVPKLGWVSMRECPRFEGRITQAIISKDADRWMVSLRIHVECSPKKCESQAFCGIDLGLNTFAQLSTGDSIYAPKPLKVLLKKKARLQRALRKKINGSQRKAKLRLKVAKVDKHIRNIRQDFLHKTTNYLANSFHTICIEDPNVKGMMANHKLARAISDVGFFEFRRQLAYKMAKREGNLIVVSRWFPSSKTCSRCGSVKESLNLGTRTFHCTDCGFSLDRDLNAAFNLLRKIMFDYELKEIPQALWDCTLVDTRALLLQMFAGATPVDEASNNQQHCAMMPKVA